MDRGQIERERVEEWMEYNKDEWKWQLQVDWNENGLSGYYDPRQWVLNGTTDYNDDSVSGNVPNKDKIWL